MLRNTLVVLVTGCLLVLSNGLCCAQDKQAQAEEGWDPVSAGPLTSWTAPVCGKGKFVIQPFFFYNHTRGTFNSEGHYDSLADGKKRYQYQEQLFIQYGLTEKFEVAAQVVYQQNYAKQGDLRAHSSGFGDSYLFLRYCALKEEKLIPHITGLLQLKVPTGKYQHADPDKLGSDLMGATSGGGSWDPGVGLIVTKKIKPFVLHADAVYGIPQKVRVDGTKTRYANYLNYDFGLEYFLPGGFNMMLEVNGFIQGDKKVSRERVPASGVNYFTVAPGIGWSCKKLQTLLVYQRVVTGTNTDANDSLILTCVYTF